jgi:hypothetical protein
MPEQGARRRNRRRVYAVVGATAVVVVAAVGISVRPEAPAGIGGDVAARASASAVVAPNVRRETRATLDPASYTGKAAAAYQVAREIPDVLDQLQCYCACRSQYGHVSLLSCYADGHGST